MHVHVHTVLNPGYPGEDTMRYQATSSDGHQQGKGNNYCKKTKTAVAASKGFIQ